MITWRRTPWFAWSMRSSPAWTSPSWVSIGWSPQRLAGQAISLATCFSSIFWGYLNQVRSSRHLEKACVRDLEALWLMRRLAPDYRAIGAFRHDNPEAIVRTSAAFVQFCREQGLVGGRMVALDGTKIRAVASPKNIAGAERLARDIEHTEREIAYYLDRLDAMDEQAAKGFGEQPTHHEAFGAAIAALRRRKDRLAKRQVELDHAQRTIHRLIDQGALDRMERRIYADPSLMRIRRCTVEHPFGTIKRMSGGGRFLTRGLRKVKAEAALSVLAFNILHAVNAFGAGKLTGAG
jgi:hypothetical protein